MSKTKSLLFVLLTFSQTYLRFAESARILCIYSVPFDSHQSVFQVITEELAERGHELVVITPLPHSHPLQNVTEIDTHDTSYRVWDKAYSAVQKNDSSFSTDALTLYSKVFMPIMREMIEIQIIEPEVQTLIRDKKQRFDIILMEACIMSNLVFVTRFNAPVILVSSFFGTENNFLSMGAAVHPLFFPDFNLPILDFHSIWDRLSALYAYAWFRYYDVLQEIEGNALVRKHFGDDAPTIQDLKKNIQMMFLNVHHIWDNNRPVPPSVVYMGALHLKKPKPIPQELKNYLDLSENGVVYVSLGSKVRFSDLPPPTLKIFLNVFASIPYDVLIKWNGGDLPDKPKNVRLEQWLPQNDMLHHPKIKLFITQGGLQSTDEAIAAKVPLLALPVFGDQFYNSHKYVQHGIGMMLNINAPREDELRDAIIKLIEDKSFSTNIARLSRIMEDQRAGALDKAMHHVEYMATYGADHLRSPLADASLRDYLLLDIFALVGLVLTVCVASAYTLLRLCLAHTIPLIKLVNSKIVAVRKCERKIKLN